MRLTAIIEREGAGFVSLCPELDIASQGDEEIEQRLHRPSGWSEYRCFFNQTRHSPYFNESNQ